MNHAESEKGAFVTLIFLIVLILFSIVDRAIISLLLYPLKVQFDISDVQFGFLFGTAFAAGYAILGLPLARVSDRYNRTRLIFAGVLLWSLCTIGSAFARSFEELLLLRVGLAIGEVVLFPAAHSLVGDLFDARHKRLAASILAATPFLGGMVTFGGGGVLVSSLTALDDGTGLWGYHPWQLILIVVGVPTLITGLLFGLIVREPGRRTEMPVIENAPSGTGPPGHLPYLILLLLGGALPFTTHYAYVAWAPELLMTRYATTLKEAGMWVGVCSGLAPAIGSLLLPLVLHNRHATDMRRVIFLTCLAGACLGTLIFALTPVQPYKSLFIIGYFVGMALFSGIYSTIIVGFQFVAAANQRATLVAATMCISSGVGFGAGPAMTAVLKDALATGFGQALAWTAIIAGGVSLVFLLAAGLYLSPRLGSYVQNEARD